MRGDRLKALRLQEGHTQESLAESLSKTTKEIWRWEHGDGAPRADTLVTLATALNTTTDYLLGLSDSPTLEPRARDLSEEERAVILALRRGDRMGAIRTIAAATETH